MKHPGRLEGKVAWISGASSGIGAATARLFAAEGARVVLAGRHASGTRPIARGIIESGGKALPQGCDVGDERQVRRSIEQTVATYGRLDILINNAGIVQVKALHRCTSADWDRVMGTNVKSMYYSLKHAFQHLERAGGGSIVNVGSISSFVGQAGTPVYTTAKHAVVGLTRSIALDYAGKGIRCNCICPGITDTPMLREHLDVLPDPEAALATRLRRVPLGRALTPENIARSILFLAGDDSGGITGTTLVIDGGYLTAAEWDTGSREGVSRPRTRQR